MRKIEAVFVILSIVVTITITIISFLSYMPASDNYAKTLLEIEVNNKKIRQQIQYKKNLKLASQLERILKKQLEFFDILALEQGNCKKEKTIADMREQIKCLLKENKEVNDDRKN